MLGILARGSGYIIVGQLPLMCSPLIAVPGFVSLFIAAAGDTLFRLSFLLVIVAFLVVPLLVGMRC